MAKIKKKSATYRAITLSTIQLKLCNMHKSIEENTADIKDLKNTIAMGKGGVKVLCWVAALLTSIVGYGFFNR